MRIEEIEGAEGLYKVEKIMIYKEITALSNSFMIKDRNNNRKIIIKKDNILDTKNKILILNKTVYYFDEIEFRLMLALVNNTFNTTNELMNFIYKEKTINFKLYTLICRFKNRFENILSIKNKVNLGYILENKIEVI